MFMFPSGSVPPYFLLCFCPLCPPPLVLLYVRSTCLPPSVNTMVAHRTVILQSRARVRHPLSLRKTISAEKEYYLGWDFSVTVLWRALEGTIRYSTSVPKVSPSFSFPLCTVFLLLSLFIRRSPLMSPSSSGFTTKYKNMKLSQDDIDDDIFHVLEGCSLIGGASNYSYWRRTRCQDMGPGPWTAKSNMKPSPNPLRIPICNELMQKNLYGKYNCADCTQ